MDIAEIGRQFGLNEAQTRAAFEQLAPVVAAGIRRNNQSDDGLAGLLKALQAGGHSQYADDPSALQYDQVAGDGNAILGHVFGSKDVSRGVANQAADLSGISSTVLKKMLPVVAAIIMGQLAKGMFGGGRTASANAPTPAPAPGGAGGGLGDILGDILGGGAGQGQATPRGGSPGGQGGGLGDILGDILGGGAGQGQGQTTPRGGPGGGGLGDILGDILGGGAAGGGTQGQSTPRGGQGGGGLGDILGDILGGGAPGGQPGNAPRPQAGGQGGPGGVSLEDLLREMMGGGQGGSDAGGYNQDVTQRSRKRLDDVLGGGTSSGNAADDLLNSVDRMTRRR